MFLGVFTPAYELNMLIFDTSDNSREKITTPSPLHQQSRLFSGGICANEDQEGEVIEP